MRITFVRHSTACAALFIGVAACGDAVGLDPGATGSTGTATTAGTTESIAPTGSTAAETSTGAIEPPTSTGEPPGTTDTISTGESESTTAEDSTSSTSSTSSTTSTGSTTAEDTSTGTTAGETDDTGGGLCEVTEDTAGGPVDWARHFGSPEHGPPIPYQLAVSPLGRIAIAEGFTGKFDFGGDAMETTDRDGFHHRSVRKQGPPRCGLILQPHLDMGRVGPRIGP